MLTDEIKECYRKVLKEELICAMGCTEPIAIAYAAALAKKELGTIPEKVRVEASGNMIKNTKSVVVPNTNGLKGIAVAAAAGIVAGDPSRKLQVISEVTTDQRTEIEKFLKSVPITVSSIERGKILDVIVTVMAGNGSVSVRISDSHTNITEILKDGKSEFSKEDNNNDCVELSDYSFMNVQDIIAYAEEVELSEVKDILDMQIMCNTTIAEEGIKNKWGSNIGRTLMAMYGNNTKTRARAYAAAGSDARMSGCELPVVINSGSGNQGLTVTMPVLVYAEDLKVDDSKKYRALIVSNLIAIHLKSGIGRLSAYCGAIGAGSAAGAAIAYLHGETAEIIGKTLINALAISSGIVCDGAKASCAGKIATAIENGILGYEMAKCGNSLLAGDGIVADGVEATIDNVARMARIGMAETDKEIIRIMTCTESSPYLH